MRKLFILLLAALMAISFVSSSVADWATGDGYKMHFPQLPDLTGWNVNATNPIILADDWMCSESGPVSEIHFWGSWMGGVTGEITSFNLSIHADIPADPPSIPYSRPGATLWEVEVPFSNVIAVSNMTGQDEGWYDPQAGVWNYPDHQEYWQYNVFLTNFLLPEEIFEQVEGTVYWLNISATVAEPAATQWGWKSSQDHWNDDAVWAESGQLNWVDLFEPPDLQVSLDLAFVITGADLTGACCYPDPTGSPDMLCTVTDSANCVNNLLGVYQGNGTLCQGMEACCLQDGSCVMADALCCVNELSGTPQGAGSSCAATPEACCFADGTCADLDPLCCSTQGGTPQGSGTACSGTTVACCLLDGSCVDVDALCCDDLGGTISSLSGICLGDSDGDGNDDACVEPSPPDTCDYYKAPYEDYVPNGMPDFDQKQDTWYIGQPPGQQWTHCGPVALANCLWWFDSKFEPSPVDPRPFYPGPGNPPANDGYSLLPSFDPAGQWDDHDTLNVMPFVDSLASYCLTNSTPGGGTFVLDLANGAQTWINNRGLGSNYNVQLYAIGPDTLLSTADFEFIRSQVMASQDVILLLGFWEEQSPGFCERVGGHYVTVAGVCTAPEDSALCISDPYLDNNEGLVHAPSIHNDAYYISGPHGTIYHDRYDVTITPCQPIGFPQFGLELVNYGVNAGNVGNFYGQNRYDPNMQPIPPSGGVIHTILEYALIICPVEPTGACCYTDPPSPDMHCVVTTQADCENNLTGVYQGDGSTCAGVTEACCLADGSCVMADVFCCTNELGGTPQGQGSSCSGLEACCLADGTCIMVDPLCCDEQGGVPQGPGISCTSVQACCLADGSCVMLDPVCCDDQGGTPQASGTSCSAEEACCLQDNSCIMADPLCCTDMGGSPQGTGTSCTAVEACCLTSGACINVDPLCCTDLGGTPQGSGTSCSGTTVACCLPDGSCTDVDPLCCDDLGGTVSSLSSVCLGDANGNNIDDACELPEGACCLTDNTCVITDEPDCIDQSGDYKGDGSVCLGDNDNDGVDDICYDWPDHKMHYPQLPDGDGWDVMATMPIFLADDWRCTESGPVKDIHFWGSWMNGMTGQLSGFHISIFSDIPANPPQIPHSIPGDELWSRNFSTSDIEINQLMPSFEEGWYNPESQTVLPLNHQEFFRYDIYLNEQDWFIQQEGTIYWLAITADVENPQTASWGWKSTFEHWNDDAVWGAWDPPIYNWVEMYEPPAFEQSLNLAFVITNGSNCDGMCGDANHDGTVNVSDAVWIINYVFVGGGPPVPRLACGDANGDGTVNVSDAVWIINYVFVGGGAPGDCSPGSPQWIDGDCCPFVPTPKVK